MFYFNFFFLGFEKTRTYLPNISEINYNKGGLVNEKGDISRLVEVGQPLT